MLTLDQLRKDTEFAKERLAHKNFKEIQFVDEIISIDDQRKAIKSKLDDFLAQRNSISKEIGIFMKNGDKVASDTLKNQIGTIKEEADTLETQFSALETQLFDKLVQLPNFPNAIVPAGKHAENNEVAFSVTEFPHLHSGALPHWDLAKKYDLIDFELGNKITGAGFPVYKGKGAALQRALISFFLDKAIEAGYAEVQVPHLVNKDSGFGTGQLPDKEGQMYHVTVDDFYLIPTAEVPITNIYRDEIIEEKILPIKNVGYTPCFRREAGSYGKDVRGLNRLHQFDKVEIVRIEKPENSYQALDEMLQHVETLLQALELPYRILRLCGGDMTFSSALTYDFEVFSAAQERWLEVSSVSNFETFQANRLKLRLKDAENKKYLAHTLNGSALALPRILASLLENHQTENGIKIPKALVPYTKFDLIS
ncbi:MAG TPA: serine--tRNA ligase [Chitinophagales bacterium]|jgi:seryl-tRNA synthetase|nr:serine--tRNA ligase [Chitinophagales bacterium]HQW80128.1 serine--tRNA ligase [Chitinophagales bacterium]HRB66677.1 serine--tRNA ligase [Chitinophagales bacterium]HRB92330.1 serine--tRNA ligase [Chitinophagales bacterium]